MSRKAPVSVSMARDDVPLARDLLAQAVVHPGLPEPAVDHRDERVGAARVGVVDPGVDPPLAERGVVEGQIPHGDGVGAGRGVGSNDQREQHESSVVPAYLFTSK